MLYTSLFTLVHEWHLHSKVREFVAGLAFDADVRVPLLATARPPARSPALPIVCVCVRAVRLAAQYSLLAVRPVPTRARGLVQVTGACVA
jgi:hypothetical protein